MKGFQRQIQKQTDFLKKKIIERDILLVPVSLVFILFSLFVFDLYQKGNFIVKSVLNPLFSYSPKEFPYLKNNFDPRISAESSVILDKDTKTVIYNKNGNLRFSTASTAKIMTALISLEFFNPSDVLVVRQATSEGSIIGLKEGDKFTFENLLYAMMLPSANDAAYVIAQNYPGGVDSFVSKMNEKARYFNLLNTHFQDPAGLLDENDYTTALELARLASFALENEYLLKVVNTQSKVIADISGFRTYQVFNRNKLLGIEGIEGIKTGFTEEAGGILVSSKPFDKHSIIFVVMRSEERFEDTLRLVNLVSSGNLTFLSIHP
ncbi:MAG: hypothetical protein A2629_01690 [Candidatus Levybacteria bacterium RIFCSPHIGHO2_01_FULL_41_15]|nr:MAG: hypothetical protein A2629_01690 [Candidatus Levybacteria bacterium RIFCSPHIGHO2_01_FULL_41_15]